MNCCAVYRYFLMKNWKSLMSTNHESKRRTVFLTTEYFCDCEKASNRSVVKRFRMTAVVVPSSE